MRRMKIKLAREEDDLLRSLYRDRRIPVDQYVRRPGALDGLTGQFNDLAGRNDSTGDIHHYMATCRKNGEWVTFDGNHRRLESMDLEQLTSADWTQLAAAYEALGIGSDNFAFDADLLLRLTAGFRQLSGKQIDGRTLVALIMALRKRGMWPKVGNRESDLGFRDIDEVG
jgi:hypothetical protein